MYAKFIEEMKKRKKEDDLLCLADIAETYLSSLKEEDKELYKKMEMKMYEDLYGKVLTEEMAEEIIVNMKPYHMHWPLEETTQVLKDKGLSSDIDAIDFWVVMNSAYNDYHSLFEDDIDKYVELSKLFIEDEDAKENKVYIYFTNIPK